ncbi:hypothetical protein KZO01_07310 [Kurthia zopfii]|uniref:ArsR family transcriptional regulator n=1 Tax=Kurthia zopfii TaxID=1650 RepID=A0A8B4QAP1_9BACL|nr:metalloregulator ArsR/SmtB family transcription factor [Kurthia zopfii]PWI22965.1 ArsR family transcriptional regulator [Kurthia zopfii]TDR40932.1 ArsR family transcriptional regulator [Kurthia zopfii]GEK30422.1 hypothetical protein KZO01_07310 [Kurthia zopfii]STX09764.1 HTH-type transcriptional repressor AseR [Kurthia zopfii]
MDLLLLEQQLKVLGDLNRLKIIAMLKNGELCVCEFTDVLQISQPAVSQHLKKLKESNIIQERKEGTWKYFRINENLAPIPAKIIDEIEFLSSKGTSCC